MRPERLEIEGFAPFRDRTEVEFGGLELFALTGPTGAGKSSVIDAIVFALYGSVPRHGRRSVSPIISLGKAHTRVRLDFTVGEAGYTIVRKIQRTSRGGVGSEARLEHEGEVLASGGEVTSTVESLLGLGIDHFTRSVVLPQGEFAAFLHDTPAGQQELVKALLDMGVLDTVRQLATERSRIAKAVVEQARVRLDQLADATPESEAAEAGRVSDLEKLVEPVAAAEEAIGDAEALVKERAADVERLSEQTRLLESVSVPDGVTELADRLAALTEEIDHTLQERSEAEAALETLVEESDNLPGRTELESARATARRLDSARQRRDAIDLTALESAEKDAATAAAAADGERKRAQRELEAVRDRHAVHALTAGLHAGDPCPVCDRPLETLPDGSPPDLGEKQAALEAAEKAVEDTANDHRRASTAVAEARAARQAAAEAVAELEDQLAALPYAPDIEERIDVRRRLDERIENARRRVTTARKAEEEARKELGELEEAGSREWERFGEARDRLAALEPPPARRDDLARVWAELCQWAACRIEHVRDDLMQAQASTDDAAAAADKQREELERLLAEAGVEGPGLASARLAAALATARSRLDRVRERREERKALESDVERFVGEAAVATDLANHLKANRFEAWLLSEALATLVDGANHLLAELTSGAYSLAMSDRAIEVVDHRNADERRSVRSLSGGETFLVSLALALSLGEQLTTLSDRGGARLEAIFLDEGFGTLDAETLETVTVVVSELAAQGRMVGVVTHVKELAEQMPFRFEVRPGPDGSSIARSGE